MRLNSKKTLVFLKMVSAMRPALKKYQEENERNSFLSNYKDLNSRSQEIDRIIQSAHFSSAEIKQIKKEINRWPWKKIRIFFFFTILLALVTSYVYFISLPRVYKISKETPVFIDSTASQSASPDISEHDIFDSEGWLQTDGMFIKMPNDSNFNTSMVKVINVNYFDWVFNSSQYFYIDTNNLTNEANKYRDVFKDYKQTSDYNSLNNNDKKAIVYLLDSLHQEYKLKFRPVSKANCHYFMIKQNIDFRIVLVNLEEKNNSKSSKAYSIAYKNKMFKISEFYCRMIVDTVLKFSWFFDTNAIGPDLVDENYNRIMSILDSSAFLNCVKEQTPPISIP